MTFKKFGGQQSTVGGGFEQIERELKVRIRQQATVEKLGQQALFGGDLATLMNETVTLVSQTLEVEYCKILELLPDGKSLLLRAGVGWKNGLVGQAIVDSGSDSQAGYTLLSREPVIVENLPTESRFSGPPLLVEHGVVSGLSVIIRGRERPFGVLGGHTTRQVTFTQDDVNFLQSAANVLAAAIERKQTEEQLRRSEEELMALNATLEQRVVERTASIQLLQDVAVAANEAENVEEAMQFVLDRVCAHTGWPVGHVYVRTQNNTAELIPTTFWHLDDPEGFKTFRQVTEATRFASNVGLPGRVLTTGKPTWIMDVTRDPDFSRTRSVKDIGVKAGFAFPVWVGTEVVAVLEFFADKTVEPNKPLLEIMAHVGTQLGRVIERKQVEEQIRESGRQLAEAQRLAHLGSWEWDITANKLNWSDELYHIYEVTPEDFNASYEGFLEWVHPDDRNFVRKAVEEAYDHRQPFNIEHRIIRSDDVVRTLQSWGKLVFDETGRPVKMIGTAQDITERKQIEAELAEVQHRLMESREAERLHLAQELHDGPLQDLYGISLRLSELWESLHSEASRGQLVATQATLQRMIQMLRTLCGELRPPALAPFGLEKAIRSDVERFQEVHSELMINLDLMPDDQVLPEHVRLALFRVYQQALSNIMRHAGAHHILVRFKLDAKRVILEIQDDGCGFEVPKRRVELARQGHLGLVGAAERTEAIGGDLEIISTSEKGTLVRAVVPRSDEWGMLQM